MLNDTAAFYGDLLPVIRQADLAVVNLECVLGDEALQPIAKAGIALRAAPRVVAGLVDVPFHLACLANNHSFDFGAQGLAQTKALLESHDIATIGAGLDAQEAELVKILQFDHARLALVNVAEGEEGRSSDGGPGVASLDLQRLRTQLAALRSQVDVVIVVAHAGREYLPVPAPYIRAAYRSLVDAGADLVIGHHPHVPQGIELYRGKPIVYSLGNFGFFMDTPVRYHHLGYLVKAGFYGCELDTLEIWPYRIEPDRLALLSGEQRAGFMAELEVLSALIVDDDRLVDVWNAYADRWLGALGVQALADSIAQLGGETRVLRSALQASLARFSDDNLLHRLTRRALWRGIRWLDHRIDARLSPPTPDQRAQAKRGAAVLRNRFDTPAHRELYLTALRRVMDDELGHAPAWAHQLLADWQVFWTSDR